MHDKQSPQAHNEDSPAAHSIPAESAKKLPQENLHSADPHDDSKEALLSDGKDSSTGWIKVGKKNNTAPSSPKTTTMTFSPIKTRSHHNEASKNA